MNQNINLMKTFDETSLPSLKKVTLAALELFSQTQLKGFDISEFKKPILVGSGNAKVTSRILFGNKTAVFADETSIDEALEQVGVDGVIIFSASGKKHAPIMAQKALDKGLTTKLITCTPGSPAQDILGEEHVVITPKNREPYTYNTSTYMGWILALTQENPKEIYDFILTQVKPKIKTFDFRKFDSFLLVTPNKFERTNELFITKFVELFGRRVARDVKSYEELKHAITVVPHNKELGILFGEPEEIIFSSKILNIPLPTNCGSGAMMAIAYYVIGEIQEQFPQYFKENIAHYIKEASSKPFGKGLSVIVE